MDNGSKRQMPKNTDQNHKQRKRSQYAQGEWENAHDRIRIHSDTTPLTSHMQQAQIHIYISIHLHVHLYCPNMHAVLQYV